MYLICHVTSHDHLIEESCNFMGGEFLQYVTTLISIVTVEIQCFKFVTWSLMSIFLKGHVNL